MQFRVLAFPTSSEIYFKCDLNFLLPPLCLLVVVSFLTFGDYPPTSWFNISACQYLQLCSVKELLNLPILQLFLSDGFPHLLVQSTAFIMISDGSSFSPKRKRKAYLILTECQFCLFSIYSHFHARDVKYSAVISVTVSGKKCFGSFNFSSDKDNTSRTAFCILYSLSLYFPLQK